MTNSLESPLAREIEKIFRERTGKDAIYLPSGRIGIFLAISTWLKPGDRVLMSPVNDDVVFYTLLASGVRPVLAPADPATGNLDPTAVDEEDWAGIDAVLTTNLYGTPDNTTRILHLCTEHGLLLDYIHGPPLDGYIPPEIADRFESQPLAVRWTRHVLPVNPLEADRFLAISKRLPALEPADAE